MGAPHPRSQESDAASACGRNVCPQTLFNLGRPPDRPEGQPGLLVYDIGAAYPKVAGCTDVYPCQIL